MMNYGSSYGSYRKGYAAEFEREAYAVDDAAEKVKEDVDMLMEKLSPEDQKDLTKLIKDEAEMIKEMGDDEAGENFLCSILPFLCGRRRAGYYGSFVERLVRDAEIERQAFAVEDSKMMVKDDIEMLAE